MSQEVVHPVNLSLDEEMRLLDQELRAYQRIWLIERSQAGVWGIAIVKDLPEHQWPEPDENGYLAPSDKWLTIAYRRHEHLAKAIKDAREDLVIRNEKEDQESRDAGAEEKFLQHINPDPVTKIATELKS